MRNKIFIAKDDESIHAIYVRNENFSFIVPSYAARLCTIWCPKQRSFLFRYLNQRTVKQEYLIPVANDIKINKLDEENENS